MPITGSPDGQPTHRLNSKVDETSASLFFQVLYTTAQPKVAAATLRSSDQDHEWVGSESVASPGVIFQFPARDRMSL